MTRRALKKGGLYWSGVGSLRIITMLTRDQVFYIQLKGRHRGVGSHCSLKAFVQWAYKEVTA